MRPKAHVSRLICFYLIILHPHLCTTISPSTCKAGVEGTEDTVQMFCSLWRPLINHLKAFLWKGHRIQGNALRVTPPRGQTISVLECAGTQVESCFSPDSHWAPVPFQSHADVIFGWIHRPPSSLVISMWRLSDVTRRGGSETVKKHDVPERNSYSLVLLRGAWGTPQKAH